MRCIGCGGEVHVRRELRWVASGLLGAFAVGGCGSNDGSGGNGSSGGASQIGSFGGAPSGAGGAPAVGGVSVASGGASAPSATVPCGPRSCFAVMSPFPGAPALTPCCVDASAGVCGTLSPLGGTCVVPMQGVLGSGGSLGSAGASFGGVAGASGGVGSGAGGNTAVLGAGGTTSGGAAVASDMAGAGGTTSAGGAGGASGAAGESGMGGASGAAGAGGTTTSPCQNGRTLLASDAGSGTHASGYGKVVFQTSMGNEFVALTTTLTVPAQPTSSSTLYVWPGLEPLPNGSNFNPIGQGVLQPVLTWGSSCGMPSANPGGWWISALYVNPYTLDAAYHGCLGGKPIDAPIGDTLDITMSLKGTVWSQVVVDRQSGQMASYDIDMMGQAQPWALFHVEQPSENRPTSDVVFTSTVLTFASQDSMACQPSVRGTNDYFSAPQLSPDNTRCCISRIILRSQGVPSTTPNGP